jgi:hypothetical protein
MAPMRDLRPFGRGERKFVRQCSRCVEMLNTVGKGYLVMHGESS